MCMQQWLSMSRLIQLQCVRTMACNQKPLNCKGEAGNVQRAAKVLVNITILNIIIIVIIIKQYNRKGLRSINILSYSL